MTKRLAYVSAFLLLPMLLSAGEPHDRAWLLLNTTRSLWMHSDNAAGFAVAAPEAFNLLDAGYAYEEGNYRRMQSGSSVGELSFDTQGALKVGKVQLWGRFRYDNTDERGSSFNTLLYDPYDERFAYTAADTVAGQWKKQSYQMQFKAAVPLGDSFAAGVHVQYTDRIAAGQIDPRAESFNYSVNVKPGLTWHPGHSTIGISGLYSNTFERSTPSISNTQETQRVFLLKGLGNWVGEQVGGSGLSTMYFRCNSWGGSLQYAYNDGWQLLAQAGFTRHDTGIQESATQPKPHGSTLKQDYNASVTAIWGSSIIHRLGLSSSYAITRGTEPTTQWNKETGEWEVTFSAEQLKLTTGSTSIEYDAFVTEGDSYSWHLSGSAGIQMKKDSYALPESHFNYTNAFLEAGVERSLRFSSGSSLILGSILAATTNLGYDYSYNGHRAGSAPVRELYPHDISVLASHRMSARISAEYAFPVGKGVNLAFCGEGEVLFAFGPDDTDPSGVTLRDRGSLLGAVRLYF